MKLSVIVPAFNREAFVGAALKSLLRQRDAADLDIIVVDDGSTDGTAAAVRQLMAEATCIRLHSQPNMGVTRTRNVGLSLVPPDTELVTFLDSDDISPAGRFAADLTFFRADPALDLTYGLMTIVDQIDEETLRPTPESEQITVRGISLTTAIFRCATLDQLGRCDESFSQAEDFDLLLRLFERRPTYVLSDTVAIYYRRHAGNATNDAKLMRREFLKAVLRSAQRRRQDPTLGDIPAVFDLTDLVAFQRSQVAARRLKAGGRP